MCKVFRHTAKDIALKNPRIEQVNKGLIDALVNCQKALHLTWMYRTYSTATKRNPALQGGVMALPAARPVSQTINPDSEVGPGSAGRQPGHPARKITGLP